jgi:hypothetical protein
MTKTLASIDKAVIIAAFAEGSRSDKWTHCTFGCEIAKNCGS